MEDEAINPQWDKADFVHDWRNYIPDFLREMWDTFTPEQKLALFRMAEEQAEAEDWD